VISVLAENLVDFYQTATSGKELWDALETNMFPTLGVNRMSWSNFVTIRWLMTIL
jgi:hypothetical protein